MYDYRKEETEDVKEVIRQEIDFTNYNSMEELEDKLYEMLWDDDSVTGNGSGSYTFSSYQAQENLVGNLDLLKEALEEFDCNNLDFLQLGPEMLDVSIRCYLLGECIADALEDMKLDYEKAVENLKNAAFDKAVLSMEHNGEEEEIREEIEAAANSDLKAYLED